jgi:hypothetical protein
VTLAVPAHAGDVSATPDYARSHQVDVLLHKILDASDAHDIAALDTLLDSLPGHPALKDSSTFDLVLRRYCETLGSADFGAALNPQKKVLAEKAALTALSAHPDMPVASRAFYLTVPMPSDDMLSGDIWAKRRASRSSEMLDVWAKLASNRPPSEQATVTKSPPSVPDSAVMAYLDTVDGQQEQSRARSFEARKELACRYYLNGVEQFLTASYSRAPYALDELRSSITQSTLPKEVQWRILGKVIYAMRISGESVD